MTTINWQQPYVNTFKHFTIASDKNAVKHGDITTVMDGQIKSTVYKIVGSSPISNFINMPKLTGQSLALSGRYIYFLFKPIPNKSFSIHIDIMTVEKVLIRVSFSNLFKEFKATTTWLQFPYVIQAPKGSVYEKTEQTAKDLSGSAPPITKWTILCIDLINLTQIYANRTYQCVRGFKICANLLIKNVITSDLLYEPGVTHAEARLRSGGSGSAFPRELAFPCEKYENWHQSYDYVSFPSESFRKPFDSVGQSRIYASSIKSIESNNNETESNKQNQQPKRVQVKQVYTSSSLGHHAVPHSALDTLTQPKQFTEKFKNGNSGGVFRLPFVGVEPDENSIEQNVHFVSPTEYKKQNEQDIHVYPFKSGHDALSSPRQFNDSPQNQNDIQNDDELHIYDLDNFESNFEFKEKFLEFNLENGVTEATNQNGNGIKSNHKKPNENGTKTLSTHFQTKLEPDPILRIKKIIGFGTRNPSSVNPASSANKIWNEANSNCILWTRDSQYLIYACQSIVVAYHVNTSKQWCFLGHADQVSCLAFSPDNLIIASGQTGPYSLVRLWDFQTRKCLAIFRSHDHSLYLLEYSSCGNYLCGVGKDKQGKTMLVIWDVKDIKTQGSKGAVRNGQSNKSTNSVSNSIKIVAKAHTDVHISKILFVHYDSSRLISCGRDNVRFWRLKDDTLRSCAVNLSPYIQALNLNTMSNTDETRDEFSSQNQQQQINTNNNSVPIVPKVFLEFTDICMNSKSATNDNLAFACTRTGQIFEFHMAKMEIENVRMLEPLIKKTGILTNKNQNSTQIPPALRLNSLSVSDSFCVTGSDDGFVRIWPLDFSQVSVEAEHEASIGIVRYSPDYLRIASATLNGNLGILDVKQKEYITLVRSHTDSIVDLSFDPSCKFIATSSNDSTVRVWNFENCRQLYDFSSPNERPTRLCFHPKGIIKNSNERSNNSSNMAIFSCGFNSGKIRIFNVNEAKLLFEIPCVHIKSNGLTNGLAVLNLNQLSINSKYEITDLTYSNDGKRLISGDSMKYLCLYDAERDYELLRMLPNCIASFGSLSLSPDNKYLSVIGSTNNLITVYESLNLNEVLRIDISTNSNTNSSTHTTFNNTFAGSSNNTLLSTNSSNPTSTSSLITGISKPETGVRLAYSTYDLNQILCVTSSNKLLKFDSKTGRLLSSIPRIHRNGTDCLNVSSDGRFLVTSGDNVIKVWDYEMRLEKNFQTFVGHSSAVNRVLFTPDNKTLISVGDSIIFWDFLAFSPQEENEPRRHEMPNGRELENMRDLPVAVIREKQQSSLAKNRFGGKNDEEFYGCETINVNKQIKSFKNTKDVNKIKILNETSFEEMKSNKTKQVLMSKSLSAIETEKLANGAVKSSMSSVNLEWKSNVSFEKPRTPPIAAEIHIETITVNGEIEDTFLNDDFTLIESNLSSSNNSSKNNQMKKFINLPNFVSNPPGHSNNNNTNNDDDDTHHNSDLMNSKEIKLFTNGEALDTYSYDQDDPDDLSDSESGLKKRSLKSNKPKPNVTKHLTTRKKQSTCAKRRYVAPKDKCGLKLNSVIGYNGKYAAKNIFWSPEREFFAFTIGSIICIEELKSGKQTILYSHQEDITVLALRNDTFQMASSSAYLLKKSSQETDEKTSNNSSATTNSNSVKSHITIWNCDDFQIVTNIFHENASNITCMSYSSDDRFMVSIGDYKMPSIVVWNTYDYSCIAKMNSLSYVIHDVAWNPCKCNELALCGQNKVLSIWSLDEKSSRNCSLRTAECEIPFVLCEKNEEFEFTTVAYSEDNLLFAATNYGLVTVWNTKSNTCFLNWQADTNEIDVLVSVKHRLITGSSKGNLKLWNVSSIHEMRHNPNKSSLRLDGLIIDNEITLNGAIKYCKFDSPLEVGIVATNKGVIWYVNWLEETSVRLVSTHTDRINSICCINDRYLSTASEDGSLNIWSITDRERIVQFEVKTAAVCQTLLTCDNLKIQQKLSKYFKTPNNKTSLILVGYADGSVRIFDIEKKIILSKMQPFAEEITSINYCKNTTIVLIGNRDGLIAVFDLLQNTTTRVIHDHKGAPITSLDNVYKEDKKLTYWLAASRDRRVSVWSSKWNEDLFQLIDWLTFPAPTLIKETTTPHLDNNDLKQNYKYWNKHPSSLAKFAPSLNDHTAPETLVYVGYGLKKTILIYNFIKKQIVRSMNVTEWPECMVISPKCNLIASGTNSRLLQLKDFKQGTFQDYAEHSDIVSSICFSNDGKRLFSTAFNEIFIWDVLV